MAIDVARKTLDVVLDTTVEAKRPEETEATSFKEDVTVVAEMILTPWADAAYAPLIEFVTAVESANRGIFVIDEAIRLSSLAIALYPVSTV